MRVLGLSKLVPVEARSTMFFANGNNVTIYGDAVRRVVTCQLDPKMERPETKQFKGDPVKLIMADRGAYIAACLTICRAYIVAGRPNRCGQIASFNGWSDTVRSALVWLGEADPLDTQEVARAEDPEVNEIQIMRDAWVQEFGTGEACRRAAAGGGQPLQQNHPRRLGARISAPGAARGRAVGAPGTAAPAPADCSA